MELPEIPHNRDLTYLGLSTFRDKNVLFGIKRRDRRQHVYVLGKSGTGKSVLLFNMIIQNIQNGEGVCVVDPHGELVEGRALSHTCAPHEGCHLLQSCRYRLSYRLQRPRARGSEIQAPRGLGPHGHLHQDLGQRLERPHGIHPEQLHPGIARYPGHHAPRHPEDARRQGIPQIDLANLKDPVIKAFWLHEYEAWQDKFRNEAIAPIQNKVGQFLSSSIIRNVVGQAKSTVNVFDIMNQGKIFLVNVSKGRIGEDNSSLLGGMIITKVQLAAMERVRIPEDERRDFYLYVDEFQNFVTDAFAGILSEARKYRLNLTIAHQYTAQLATKDSSAMRDAVFGNVGTMIIFRVGADDAEFLEKEFEPEFTQEDIVNLPNYKIYLKLMIDGITSRPFSAKTLPPLVKSGNKAIEDEVIETSRRLYCRPKDEIEREINEWSGMKLDQPEADAGPEKFPVICSICNKETTVPFKPEPGRPVYCKDCIAKMKAGELQPLKVVARDVTPARVAEPVRAAAPPKKPASAPAPRKSAVTAESMEKVFYPPPREKRKSEDPRPKFFENPPAGAAQAPAQPPASVAPQLERPTPDRPDDRERVKENSALRDILNKTLSEQIFAEKPPAPKPDEPKTIKVIHQVPISLDSLKPKSEPMIRTEDKVVPVAQGKDRAASADSMNRLKDLIQQAVPPKAEAEVKSQEKPEEKTQPKAEIKQEEIKKPEPSAYVPPQPSKAREIPEDVLRKILG
ncbi:MAG: CxxC-x17-CxxC domain-containing protein, partial [bacterium]